MSVAVCAFTPSVCRKETVSLSMNLMATLVSAGTTDIRFNMNLTKIYWTRMTFRRNMKEIQLPRKYCSVTNYEE